MKKSELIDSMMKTRRLKLSFWQKCTHYWPVFFLFLVPLFTCYSLLEIYVLKNYEGIRSAEELIAGTWIWIPIGLFVWFIQWNRLKFQVINTTISPELFAEGLRRTAKELDWTIVSKTKFSALAHRNSDFMSSWGEMITIFYRNDTLYINAIPDPDQIAALTTFGRCKNNRVTFLRNLKAVRNKEPEKEAIEEEGMWVKWTFWNVFARILIYPLALSLIFIGTFIICDSGNFFTGLPLIAVCAFFLFADIKIMFFKNSDST